MNQLLQTAMPRNGYTQNRTFQWTGSDMTSTTNPENGTVTYTYDGGHHVTQRTDAKGQQTRYTYDSYGRLTLTQHYLLVSGSLWEDPAQDVSYYYDCNPFDGSFSNNSWGRLTAVTFANTNLSSMDDEGPGNRETLVPQIVSRA